MTDANGTLRLAGTYSPGGLGGILHGSIVDHTASQGSLVYDRPHGLLYAVNAGSDTITVFSLLGDRLVGRQVISSGGTFAVSVTVHGKLVYVLNARDGGSVQGFLQVAGFLIKVPTWHRALGLDASQTPEFAQHAGPGRLHPGRVKAGRHHQGQRQRHRRLRGGAAQRALCEADGERRPGQAAVRDRL
jgi:hypothetical protein